jgi:NosR/NirI family nitrous oxide reductase transcriptional regulator
MTTLSHPNRVRMLAGHGLRLTAWAAVAWCVHVAHARHVARLAAVDLAAVPLEVVRKHLPEAAAIGADSPAVAGGRDVVGERGHRVGTMFKTSPAGDAAIGFSGPTDLLVVCDADLRVAGMEILSSRDTRDHVRAIERDERFLTSLAGTPLAELAGLEARSVDAVAGSTLTSLAIVDAIVLRLGGSGSGSRFEKEPALGDLRLLFPDAVAIEPDPGDPSLIRVRGPDDIPLGWALRTSPAADRVIGYQGPTDALVGFDTENRVAGVAVLESFDNEPYVGYVRDDLAFRGLWRGMPIVELAGIAPAATGVEGVSGATMTSQAVAEGIVRAARERQDRGPAATGSVAGAVAAWLRGIEPPQWGAIGLIAIGVVTAFTRLRGSWFGRLALPVAVLAYLGFGAGALLSQAQTWGWAQAGVPRGAVVLAVLAVAAVLLPATTRRNVYCSHLCAHGAAQQLLVRFAKPKGRVPAWLRPWLTGLPWALLALAILTAAIPLPLNLVDLEPFDAYLPLVAGIPALVIFAAGLLASAREPMAYCRHACPTGALLDHLRLNRQSGAFTWRDAVLLACLAAAAAAGMFSPAAAAELPAMAGPAMGTTYRVVLAADIPGHARGAVHREIEKVLARIDAAANAWREDSDVSRFNRASLGEWVEVGEDLSAIVAIARQVHAETDGAFDITVGPLVRLWRAGQKPTDEEVNAARRLVGMELVESRAPAAGQPAALRKGRDGVMLDLGGIGPGYGVDAIGERLAALGSKGHLVELGGEVRAWGTRPDGGHWRLAMPHEPGTVLELVSGEAVAFSTVRAGRAPVDPRTGRPAATPAGTYQARAASCAVADARAVSRAVGWNMPHPGSMP